jgi:HTH-type transcriptional regulator/antitoxin MqsA
MKCASCGAAELVPDTRDIAHEYKGHKTILKATEGKYCPTCGESIHGHVEGERLSQALLAFKRQIDDAQRN